MITLTRDEAQQVLDALVNSSGINVGDERRRVETVETLRTRLSAPEPEPVAHVVKFELDAVKKQGRRVVLLCDEPFTYGVDVPLYTYPPQREWQDLTNEDFDGYCKTLHPLWNTRISRTEAESFFMAGVAKLKEKNE